MKIMKTISVISFVMCLNVFAQHSSSDSTLSLIETHYRNGQYISAELEARRMFEQKEISDSVKVQLEKWIAFSLIAQGKSASAKERFVSLFSLNDTFELDPILTSPKILTVFNEARVSFISRRKNSISDSVRSMSPSQHTFRPPPSYRTIIFPGWEQLYVDRTTAGYVFFTAGMASLTSGIAFEILRARARDEYLSATSTSDITSKYNTYNSYRKAEIYSFAAFAVVYLFSELDVFTQSGISMDATSSLNGNRQLTFSIKF